MTPFPDYPTPADEEERLRSLERTLLLDTESDADLDRITTLASETLDTPIALISLVDRERQWFLSRVGLEASQTPRSMAFCAHAITQCSTLVVPDALDDPRFNTNPLVVSEPKIRFYAGAQLRPQDGQALGTLCVIDRAPRQFSPRQLHWLQLFSEQVSREIELRQRLARCPITGFFRRSAFEMLCQKEFERAWASLMEPTRAPMPLLSITTVWPKSRTTAFNSGAENQLGKSSLELSGWRGSFTEMGVCKSRPLQLIV
ncbi:GAF domain-containing protein [Synechococcus sp. CBW1107]|uniref:GAF domain-containing protein n=1 Tax=Synechococcus sp. CBW1107 TaxID=2789857 RepID=UPI0018CF4D68|nr:GAF domain-containing protein [Synechococcus sp. CBW1107]QPN56252.1 GAF domain-containing protein [Synechococcus sp. CBW1107]